jgi:hypothetical protein
MRHPVGLAVYAFLAISVLPMASFAATLTGHVLHNGSAITNYTTTAARFWARDESTGETFPINPTYSNTTGFYSIPNVLPGIYGIQVYFDAAEPYNGQYFPGDYYGWTSPIVVPEGAETVSTDLNCNSLIHLTSPADNTVTFPPYPYYARYDHQDLLFQWDPILEASQYEVRIDKYQTDPYGYLETLRDQWISSNQMTVNLPPNEENEHYQFYLYAQSGGGMIGQLMVVGSNWWGWDFRFRIVSPATAGQIPIQGLEANHEGIAAWNADGTGPEAAKTGHALWWVPVGCGGSQTPSVALYYQASRDFVGFGPSGTHGLPGATGFPTLVSALAANGFTIEELTVSWGPQTLGNDVEHKDWSFDPSTSIETRFYTGGNFEIKLRGEKILWGSMPRTTIIINYNNLANCFDDQISGETEPVDPGDITFFFQAPWPEYREVATAFLNDIGNNGFKFVFNSFQPAVVAPQFTGNGRQGAFFDLQNGQIERTLLPGTPVVSKGNLPRTGQSRCYDNNGFRIDCAGTGQDGEVQAGRAWPVPRFTDHGNGAVTDHLTGLMWTKDANLIVSRNPGFDKDGIPGDGRINWQHALDYVASLNTEAYLGYTHWRLPNRVELLSLRTYNTGHFSSLNFTALPLGHPFTDVQIGLEYWSSTSFDTAHEAWAVGMFVNEIAIDVDKAEGLFLWPVRSGSSGTVKLPRTGQTTCYDSGGKPIACAGTGQDGEVRAGTAWPVPRFTDHEDGTVTDHLTGLMWTKEANLVGSRANWSAALNHVAGMNAGIKPNFGFTNWRLPNILELQSLVDLGESLPALPAAHPFTFAYGGTGEDFTISTRFWSSTTRNSLHNFGLTVDMSHGRIPIDNFTDKNAWANYVWAVRDTSFTDGVVGSTGGTVTDTAGTGAAFSVGPGVLPGDTTVTIEVIPDPGVNPPAGFQASGTSFVSITLAPNRSPLPPPGATITLPLAIPLPPGTTLSLFKIDPSTGRFIDTKIVGTVDQGGATATFSGVIEFSIFVGLQPTANRPPVADAGPDQVISVGARCQAAVTLDGTGSTDPDGDTLTYTWTGSFGTASGGNPTVNLALGTHTIALTVSDGRGGTASDTVIVKVVDTTPPTISSVSASPAKLWPPDKKMVPVTVKAEAADNCGGISCKIISVSSNEPPNSNAVATGDAVITGNLTLNLRADRNGNGSGRVYTITVQCTDASGNSSLKTTTVSVPHDQGK